MFKEISFKVTPIVTIPLLTFMATGGWFLNKERRDAPGNHLSERGRIKSITGTHSNGCILEDATDNGVFTIAGGVDTEYEEKGGLILPLTTSYTISIRIKRYPIFRKNVSMMKSTI